MKISYIKFICIRLDLKKMELWILMHLQLLEMVRIPSTSRNLLKNTDTLITIDPKTRSPLMCLQKKTSYPLAPNVYAHFYLSVRITVYAHFYLSVRIKKQSHTTALTKRQKGL